VIDASVIPHESPAPINPVCSIIGRNGAAFIVEDYAPTAMV